ncbi:hypothetical protein Cgig2_015110 [Carnegiea gigantea]|uniref:Uncharacterized protein n=1 Tax=Carnegiea gigantea TaxID=171969 RepID=A0A9Q1QMI4_9CARY|nr:hypothetical protein Cgig2_015110 [Carnegiea gigantea]
MALLPLRNHHSTSSSYLISLVYFLGKNLEPMSLTAMDALSSSIFISRILDGNINNPGVQPPEFAIQPSNNRIGTLKINQSFNLSLWVSSSQRIRPSGSRFWPFQRTFWVKVLRILDLIMGTVQFLKILPVLARSEKLPLFYPDCEVVGKEYESCKGYNDQVMEESNAKILFDEVMLALLHGVLDFFPKSFG